MVKISVLMPFFNNEKYLDDAIESILQQTYSNFEFVIINDGSTDSSDKIVKKYLKDKRIRYFINTENLGLVESLNKGITLSKGEYIARMDGDDISEVTRLEKQIMYLEKHKKVGLLGTQGIIINEKGEKTGNFKRPLSDFKIRTKLMEGNSFIHGSVMMRKNKLLKTSLYESSYKRSEDYALWLEFIKITEVANLSDSLYRWRSYGKSRENNVELMRVQEENFASIQRKIYSSNRYLLERALNKAVKILKKKK